MTEFTKNEQIVLLALVNGETRKRAAQMAGVSESTVYRLLSNEHFKTILNAERKKIFDAAVGELAALTTKANETLRRALNSGTPQIEVRAALGILTLAFRGREMEIIERIEKLETLNQLQTKRGNYEIEQTDYPA